MENGNEIISSFLFTILSDYKFFGNHLTLDFRFFSYTDLILCRVSPIFKMAVVVVKRSLSHERRKWRRGEGF